MGGYNVVEMMASIILFVLLSLLSFAVISFGEKSERRRTLERPCGTPWCTQSIEPDTGDLEAILYTTGFYVPWGVPFKTFDEVRSLLRQKKVLIIGDSYQENMFIEMVDLWYGITRTKSTTSNKNKSQRITTRAAWVDLAQRLCYADDDCRLEYSAKSAPLMSFLSEILDSDSKKHDNKTDAHLLANRKDDTSKYGIASMFNFQLYLKTHGEDLTRILKTYDLVVIGCMVHDVDRQEKWVPFKHRFQQYRKSLGYVLDSLDMFNVSNTLWVGSKSYNNTGTPQGFVDAQYDESLEEYFRQAAEHHNKSWIDHLELTGSCIWKNCSVEDHHHSRFVNRAKALHVLEVARENGFL